MVKQIPYAQVMRNLLEKHEVEASSSLKKLNPFIDKEIIPRLGERLQQFPLPNQIMHQMIKPSNHHFTKLVF